MVQGSRKRTLLLFLETLMTRNLLYTISYTDYLDLFVKVVMMRHTGQMLNYLNYHKLIWPHAFTDTDTHVTSLVCDSMTRVSDNFDPLVYGFYHDLLYLFGPWCYFSVYLLLCVSPLSMRLPRNPLGYLPKFYPTYDRSNCSIYPFNLGAVSIVKLI